MRRFLFPFAAVTYAFLVLFGYWTYSVVMVASPGCRHAAAEYWTFETQTAASLSDADLFNDALLRRLADVETRLSAVASRACDPIFRSFGGDVRPIPWAPW